MVRSAVLKKRTEAEALERKEFLSISEAARVLGVCRPTIYKYIKCGSLTPVRKSEGGCKNLSGAAFEVGAEGGKPSGLGCE